MQTFLSSIEPEQKDRSQFIFKSPKGKFIDLHNFANRHWHPALKVLGIESRNPYQMRHSLQTGEFYQRYGKDYKPVTDGWGHLLELNQQGYGVYFVVGHGGERNNDITHGSTLFHESDRATLECQQLEIERISSEFGKPTAVAQTKKSLHADWASSETISTASARFAFDRLATYQRRWLQYSNCDTSISRQQV